MLQLDFFSKSSKCGLAHLCMMPSLIFFHPMPMGSVLLSKPLQTTATASIIGKMNMGRPIVYTKLSDSHNYRYITYIFKLSKSCDLDVANCGRDTESKTSPRHFLMQLKEITETNVLESFSF